MHIRKAERTDLPAIVELLATDALGSQREKPENPLAEAYQLAFERISSDPAHELVVAEEEGMGVIGTLQLSFIPYLTYTGGMRAQIEAVRIKSSLRAKGYGQKLIEWAIERAREQGAHMVQLTTDKQRPEAIHFYEKLGFVASHEGMKLHLPAK